MSIFYVDLYNGNDANDGTSWATAWRTGVGGPTAARIAPNDEIRFSKTPDPISIGNVTWPSFGKILTLSAARTQLIWSGDNAWIVSPSMAASTRGTTAANFKVGSGYYSLIPQAAFTTGKMGYYTLPATLDLSAYQELTFWLRSIAQTATVKICLCSDTIGNVIVDSFYIPAQVGSNLRPITITKSGGGSMGNAIQSIAVYAETDPSTVYYYFNWFTASKTNDINFTSLISKNGNAQGGDEPYYPIAYVNGTDVHLASGALQTLSATKGCAYAVSETVETFVRQTFIVPAQPTIDTSIVCLSTYEAGSKDNLIKYIGGWEIGTANCNGETYFSGTNSLGVGIYVNHDYISISLMSAVRFASGMTAFGNNCEINVRNMLDNRVNGVLLTTTFDSKFTLRGINNNGENGLQCLRVAKCIVELVETINNISKGVLLTSCAFNHFKDMRVDNTNILLQIDASYGNRIKYTGAINTGLGWGICHLPNGFENIFYDSAYYGNSDYLYYSGGGGPTSREYIKCINFTVGATVFPRYIATFKANAFLQSVIVHDTEPVAWKVGFETTRGVLPFDIPLAAFAFNADKLVTITVWVKLNSLTVSGRIKIYENHTFLDSEIYTDAANTTDWQQLTITFTPTYSGVAELLYSSWPNENYLLYSHVGSISITQAD